MHAQSVKVFIWCSCNANAVVMCRPEWFFPQMTAQKAQFCAVFFTLTRSRGQAAEYCCMDPEYMPAGYSLAAPFIKNLGYWCGTVGCSPQPSFWAKSYTVWHSQLYPVVNQAGRWFFFVKVVPTESSKVQEWGNNYFHLLGLCNPHKWPQALPN